jgi:hypothetical protein
MAARLFRPLSVLNFAPVTLALAALLGLAPAARAADGDPGGIAVLGIEALDAQDNAIANDITEALRLRVTSTRLGSPQLQGKDLVELKLIFSCPDDALPCLAQAGKSLGATELLFGNIKRSAGELTLNLKLLDASRGVLEGSLAETIPKRKPDAAALRALAAQWLAKLNGKASSGAPGATLIIRSNVAGASITLDGVEAGVTNKKGLTLGDIVPGKHEITAEKPGYGRISQQFSVGASQALPLTLALQPDGTTESAEGEREALSRPPPMHDEPPASDDALRGWMRTGFWVALGVSAVSLGLATKYGLDVRSINRDLDPYRYPTRDFSAAEMQTIRDKLDEGNRAETRQWIFVGVGSAFAVASGFLFFYKGYLDKEAGSGTRTGDNHGLRIFPTANTATGGIAAEFDF